MCIEWKEGDVYLDAIPMALDGKAFTARSADSPGATATCRVNGVPPNFVLTKGIHVLTTPKDPAFKITLWVDIPKTTTTLGAPAPPATTGCAVTTGVELYGGEVTPSGKAGIDNGSPCVITHAGPFSICLKWAEGGHDPRDCPDRGRRRARHGRLRRGGIHTCEAVVGRGAPTFVLTKGIHVLTTPKDPSFRVTMYVDTPVPVGAVCATLVGAALAGTVGGGYRRARKHPTDAILKVVPLGLLVAVVCVVISRSVHFQPGYLFGLLGGLSFTVALDKREAGRSRLAACVVTLLVALGAWLVFGPVSSVANHPHPAVWAVALNAVLAALFIGGIEGLLFGLLPLKFMPGHQLALWSWAAWAAITMAVAVVFVQVLLRPSTGYLGKSSTASVTVTYGLFVVFGILSVAFWGWFRLRPDPPAVAVPAPVEPDFEGADGPQ